MPNGQITLSKKIDKVEAKVDRVLEILLGDPDAPEQKGVIERMRNTEDWQKSEKWAVGIMGAMIIGDLGARLLGLIKGK